MSTEFPTTAVVRPGAILGTIVNSIMVAQLPELEYLRSWDGVNYNVNDGEGTFGTITFGKTCLVAAFFDVHSKKSPYRSATAYEISSFFEGMLDDHHKLLEGETLQFLLQNYQGKLVPLVTASFWDDGERLTGALPWDELLANGAEIVAVELMENKDAALSVWEEQYDMSLEQVQLAQALFQRTMTMKQAQTELEDAEFRLLRSMAHSEEAIAACRRSFSTIGIVVP